jgi:energy-coupling factor transport system substrate-specific component
MARIDPTVTLRLMRRVSSNTLVLVVASLVGLGCFLYPFFLPIGIDQQAGQGAQTGIAPLIFAVVGGVCMLAMLATVSDAHDAARSRTVALLGVLVAVDATLRLVPSFLGASPIFPLIILVGTVFGAAIGFQMGVLTLLFSALITGGLGPWLPFQMMGAGWVGLTAGWLPRPPSLRWRVVLIAVFGALWGIAFGALMNLWFWPFSAPGAEADTGLYWSPGLDAGESIARYARFYLATSLGFDMARAIGNVVLVTVFGGPILRLLERYRTRFTWTPWTELELPPTVRPEDSGA